MSPVLKVSLAVDFYIFPGKLLAQPVEAGRGDHRHRALSLLRFHFLLQEDIDAEGIDARVGHGHEIGGFYARAQQVCCQIAQRLRLREGLLFPRPLEEERRECVASRLPSQQRC